MWPSCGEGLLKQNFQSTTQKQQKEKKGLHQN